MFVKMSSAVSLPYRHQGGSVKYMSFLTQWVSDLMKSAEISSYYGDEFFISIYTIWTCENLPTFKKIHIYLCYSLVSSHVAFEY